MRIFEYNPNLGTFSLGFEHFPHNEVVEVANLDKNAEFSYNNTHKQWFLSSFDSIKSYETQKDYDLAILNPNIGKKIGRRGKKNFKQDDLDDCFVFLEREKPKFTIITMDLHSVPLLNTADDYVRDGFNQLSKDIVIEKLQQMGYKAILVAIDEANYGIATHKGFSFYFGVPKNFDLKFPKGAYNKYGRGNHYRYRSIAEAICDLGDLGEWSAYRSKPRNTFQMQMRGKSERTTWHFHKRAQTEAQIGTISKILQGSSASKTKDVRQNHGYNRPKWNQICPTMDEHFYLVSDSAYSIHPIYDRTFTIREGMRIMGLPDAVSLDLKVTQNDAAELVVNSIAPVMGEASAIALSAIAM